jgi:hypothetical protein
MAAQQPTTTTDEYEDDTGPLCIEVTIACLYCAGTGKTPFTLGLHTCGHCHGLRKRTLKRRLTPRETIILLRSFGEYDVSEPTADNTDGKEAR